MRLKTLVDDGGQLKYKNCVDTAAVDRLKNAAGALHYMTYLLSDLLHLLLLTDNLYSESGE